MDRTEREPKPRWVKLTGAALALTVGVPVVLSFVFFHRYQFWQLLALTIGCAWLFICGFFTSFKPLPVARYFARPGTYELMLHDKHPTFTRVYFGVAGGVMMLIALVLGSVFFVLRNAPPPNAGHVAARP